MDFNRLETKEGEQRVKSVTLLLFIEEHNHSLLESLETEKKQS